MIPLRIQVLFHWKSQEARRVARELFQTFSALPTGEGPRVPVRYGARRDDGRPPSALRLGAKHEILVVLVDERMARRTRSSDRPVANAWAELLTELVAAHGPEGGSPHRVLPVALDAAAFGLASSLEQNSFVRLDVREGVERERHLVLHGAIRALRLLQGRGRVPVREIDAYPEVPVSLFISHAKGDLPADPAALAEGPVKAILARLAEMPVEGWYDAKKIPAGGRFPDEIEKGVLESSALVAVLTDSWSTREWCRREVLEAKAVGRPILVVDALQQRVVRLFPYVGNAPTVRWRAAIADMGDEASWAEQRRRWEREDASTVIEATLLEALRYLYEHELLREHVEADEVALGVPPEALTLAHLPAGTRRVWYPDPPLGSEELERLRVAADGGDRSSVVLTTPLSELASWQQPPGLDSVALSLSGAPDSEDYGGSSEHLALLAGDIVLYLLLAGLRVAYGGVLGHEVPAGGTVAGDDINYVDRLLSMARSYSVLLNQAPGARTQPIQNWVAWPIHRRFGDDEYRVYGREAVLEEVAAPPDLEVGPGALDPDDNGFFPPNTPLRRYAWARSLTFMRETMLAATSARIVMGGKLTGYQGLWPGVLEEGVLSFRAGQPLYLLGVFGGAARLMIDTLLGADREELSNPWFEKNVDGWVALRQEYERQGRAVVTPEELRSELTRAGTVGLASALNNGLSDDDNRELFESDDPQRIVALILQGLQTKIGRE